MNPPTIFQEYHAGHFAGRALGGGGIRLRIDYVTQGLGESCGLAGSRRRPACGGSRASGMDEMRSSVTRRSTLAVAATLRKIRAVWDTSDLEWLTETEDLRFCGF